MNRPERERTTQRYEGMMCIPPGSVETSRLEYVPRKASIQSILRLLTFPGRLEMIKKTSRHCSIEYKIRTMFIPQKILW
jgi:hypothetical protein